MLAQTTADTTTLINHLETRIENYNEVPKTAAGYDREENYTYLEKKNIDL